MRTRPNLCANMNHRRSNAPVRHCPECGGVVNAQVATQQCSEEKHATARRRLNTYCVACGAQLIVRAS